MTLIIQRKQPQLEFIFSAFLIYFQNPLKVVIAKGEKGIKDFNEVALCLIHKAIPTAMHATENGSPSNHPWKQAEDTILDCVLKSIVLESVYPLGLLFILQKCASVSTWKHIKTLLSSSFCLTYNMYIHKPKHPHTHAHVYLYGT